MGRGSVCGGRQRWIILCGRISVCWFENTFVIFSLQQDCTANIAMELFVSTVLRSHAISLMFLILISSLQHLLHRDIVFSFTFKYLALQIDAQMHGIYNTQSNGRDRRRWQSSFSVSMAYVMNSQSSHIILRSS